MVLVSQAAVWPEFHIFTSFSCTKHSGTNTLKGLIQQNGNTKQKNNVVIIVKVLSKIIYFFHTNMIIVFLQILF